MSQMWIPSAKRKEGKISVAVACDKYVSMFRAFSRNLNKYCLLADQQTDVSSYSFGAFSISRFVIRKVRNCIWVLTLSDLIFMKRMTA